jgi:hypothetical protein
LIAIPTQSLRFDTLSIALSYKDSFYCEWLILLLIYFGKQNTTSMSLTSLLLVPFPHFLNPE